MPGEGTETQVLKRVHTRLPRCCVAELGVKPELCLGLPEKQEQHTRSHQVGKGGACKALPPQTKVKDDSWEAELALGVGGTSTLPTGTGRIRVQQGHTAAPLLW